MTDIPFIAIGNDELSNAPLLEGDKIKCVKCGKSHRIFYGTDAKTGEKIGILSFYKCRKISYLAGIDGKALQ